MYEYTYEAVLICDRVWRTMLPCLYRFLHQTQVQLIETRKKRLVAWKHLDTKLLGVARFYCLTNQQDKVDAQVGWWRNISWAPISSFVHECDCANHDIDRVDLGLKRSNLWSLGTLKALRHHLTHPLECSTSLITPCSVRKQLIWFNGSQLSKMKKSIPDMSLP